MRLIAAPDKFRGTIDATDAAAAIADAARSRGWLADELPLSDGGEGFAKILGGRQREVSVAGPLGRAVMAHSVWSDDGLTAVIEMAEAAGRGLLPSPQGDDPVRADTTGVGQLIVDAVAHGATTIIVGCGGSATTDGGHGAIVAIDDAGGLGTATLLVATDVTTRFIDAARVFAPQKGATPEQVVTLERRLEALAGSLARRCGHDIASLERSGAAGGLAGGLMALGAQAVSGFDLLADLLSLDELAVDADLVITGEGRLDASSLEGKVVVGLARRLPLTLPLCVVAGSVEDGMAERLSELRGASVVVRSVSELVGDTFSRTAPHRALQLAVEDLLGEVAIGG